MKSFLLIALTSLLCFQLSANNFLLREDTKHERLKSIIEMKKYKVIALSVGAKSNKIFSAGDQVSEDAFEEGVADELVKKGFLKDIDELNLEESQDEIPDQNELDNLGESGDKEVEPPINTEIQTEQPTEINPVIGDFNDQQVEGNDVSDSPVDTNQPVVNNEIESIPDLDKITKSEIIRGLKEKGIEYDVNSSKQELYNALYNKN